MDNQNFTTAIVVEQSPSEAFKAINNPRAWWSEEIEGTNRQTKCRMELSFWRQSSQQNEGRRNGSR